MRYYLALFVMMVVGATSSFAQAPLRSGDTVDVRLSGVPAQFVTEFSQVYNVDNRGLVNLPYIGEVQAEGLLPSQLQTDIQRRLVAGKIYTNPTITVSTSAERFVNVTGAVKGGGRIAYTPDMTLMSAISASGGFSEFANQKKIRLTRAGRVYPFDGRELKKRPETDPKLLPGDQIEVETSWGIPGL